MTWHLRRFEVVEAWMQNATPDQCRAMRKWIEILPRDPELLSNGAIIRNTGARRQLPLHYAVVPGTDAMVTFVIGSAPIRIITFVSVVPAPEW